MAESTDLTTEPKPKSQAEQQRDRMDKLVDAVKQRSAQLKTLLAETGIPFERFVEVFRRALIKGAENQNTNLLLADAGSVIQACIDACTAGVLPDGKKGAIVIYNTNVAPRGQAKQWVKRAQFLVMYEGMLQIAYGSGNFTSIMAHVVYETDEWDYEMGINPWIKHKPGKRPVRPDGAPAYQVIAAYAVAKTTNGGVFVEVFEPEDIRKVMAVSRATSGPAKDWPEQMARKGPLRRMWKFLPRDSRMDRILEVDEPNYDLEVPEPEPERKLTPGFRQPALTEGADLKMDVEAPSGSGSYDQGTGYDPGAVGYERQGRRSTPERARAHEPAPEPEAAEEVPLAPWAQTFTEHLIAATSWLNVKQALKTLAKTEMWDYAGVQTFALQEAWTRFRALGDNTDVVTDPWLFEAWLVGAEPDSDSVEANFLILEGADAFQKADDAQRARIKLLVDAATGAEEDTG